MLTLPQQADLAAQLLNDPESLRRLWEMDYDRKPVDIRTFVNDPYYFGAVLTELHESWVQDLEKVFDPDRGILEWLISGSIGCGKTFVASVALGYCVYRLTCLKNPASFYGLNKGSKIVFGIFNVTLTRSDTVYDYLRTWFNISPYFKENCPLRKRPKDPMNFPSKNIEIVQGSVGEHVLGENMFGFMLDEANFFKTAKGKNMSVGDKTRAHTIYTEGVTRQESRFSKYGPVPGLNICMSSAQSKDSFTEDRRKKMLTGDVSIFISEKALWETRDGEITDWFQISLGNSVVPAMILEDDEVPPDGVEVVSIPTKYRKRFEDDLDYAIRNIAGIPVAGAGKFFSRTDRVHRCIDETREHPFTRNILNDISIDNAGVQISDYLNDDMLFRKVRSATSLKINPYTPRSAHVDIGYTGDSAGLAICHIDPKLRTLYYDMVLRIDPPKDSETDIESFVTFFQYLRSKGVIFSDISYDQFQSKPSQQQLYKKGFNASQVSVGYTEYAFLRRMIYSGPDSVSYYRYAPVLEEFADLEKSPKIGGNPDHTPKGSNDILDAMAGAASHQMANMNGSEPRGADGKSMIIRHTPILSGNMMV